MLALLLAASVFAQSTDPTAPTPVLTNEIAGRIAPLDIGDARSTRFFYTFNGLQGDLELAVESSNLDGDIDIFLAGNLRPLTKVTLYAGATATKAAKSVYLRRSEPLILRVQARTPNDADGTYRITLGGAFRPSERLASDTASSGETLAANPSPTPARSADRKVKRVSSVGARIEEPIAEVVKEETERSGEPPAETPPVTAKKAPATPRPPRAGTRRNPRTPTARRGTTGAGTRTREPDKTEAPKPEDSRAEAETAEEKPSVAPKPERARPVRVPRSRSNRNTSAARRTGTPPAEVVPASPAETAASPAPSTRLVLILRDGETFTRDMSDVRRVTVEKGVIVIVSKNGKVERQPMSAVLRMSIEP